MRKALLLLFLLFPLIVHSQAPEPKEIIISPTQKLPQSLFDKMTGVRYADLQFTKETVDLLINNPQSYEVQIYQAFIDYLKEHCALKHVIVTESQRMDLYKVAPSQCDFVFPSLEISDFKSDFLAIGKVPVTMNFAFCDNTVYKVQMVVGVNGNTVPYRRFKREFASTMLVSKHDTAFRLKLPTGLMIPNAEQLAKAASSSKYEGVYELFEVNGTQTERVAVYKDGETFRVIHLSGGYMPLDWIENEQIGVLIPTASEKDFRAQFNDSMKNGYMTALSFENENVFTYTRRNGRTYKYIRIK